MKGEARLAVGSDGVVEGVCFIPSPNCDERPAGARIELLVIHSISLPPGEFGGPAIIQLFTNTVDHGAHPCCAGLRGLRVSAHFLIRRRGQIVQFVPCNRRAWHAGESCWQGRARCNDFSVGVELEGADDRPFTESQYRALAALGRALTAGYPIRAAAGPSDVAPRRKTDPGPHFDWDRVRHDLGLRTPRR